MKLTLIVVKLLFLGALFIISNQSLHLIDSNERQVFFDNYSAWMENIAKQGAEVTAYVVRFEWMPYQNSTIYPGSDKTLKSIFLDEDR